MIVEKQKARATLLGRRKRAIIILSLLAVVLIAAAVTINHFVRFVPFTDVDGTEYRVMRKAGKFGLYDKDGNKLEAEDEYSFFVTPAGTLVDVDADTGATQIIAQVDTEDGEANDDRNQLLIFPKIGQKELSKLEVHNDKGSFTFLRYDVENDRPDNKFGFAIESSPLVNFDQMRFTELYVNAGYTMCTEKIKDPIKDERGEFSEYGLVSETRTDEEGNPYEYEPAYYIITDIAGKSHKVIIGDMLVTGGGYYAQYVDISGEVEKKRDAVYVLQASIGDTLLDSVETFVSPQIVYQMSVSDYLDVENFSVFRYEGGELPEYVVDFTFIPLEERQGTILANKPFVFEHEALEGYNPNVDNISAALYNLYGLSYEKVCKLSPEDEDFVKYGLAKFVETTDEKGNAVKDIEYTPKYILSFYYDLLDAAGQKASTIKQVVYVSEANEVGNYYAYTFVYEGHPDSDKKDKDEKFLFAYDMICEISAHSFEFLNWKQTKWINNNYIDNNIAFIDTIDIKSGNYSASFDLDNTKTQQDGQSVSSALLEVHATDSKGHDTTTFSTITVMDKDGVYWTVTPTDLSVTNYKGQSGTITSAYLAYNRLGRQVKCYDGYIETYDGYKIKASPDTIEIIAPNGVRKEYVRYATSLFRQFYQTLLVGTIVDEYKLSEAEEAALLADDSKLLLTMTVKDTEGSVKEFKFHKLTSRKAYITINGDGGFYVMTDRIEKILTDAEKFFNNIPIDPMTKN